MNEYENIDRTTLEALLEAGRVEWIATNDALRAASKTVTYLTAQKERVTADMFAIIEVLDMIDEQDA